MTWVATWVMLWVTCSGTTHLANRVEPRVTRSGMTQVAARVRVTPSFYSKTECIPLCVPGSSFTHKATNSGINNITSVYYIVSYYKNLLQVQKGISNRKDTILPQADDRGFHMPRRSLHQSSPHLLSSRA
jgi:hypothetical protein